MNDTTLTPVAAATQYMALGWSLCGIAKGSKGPNYKDWGEIPLRLDQICGQGLGLIHGLSWTCAIDIDDLQDAIKWFASHGVDLEALLLHDDAVLIESGVDNHAKLLFRLPPGVRPLPTRKVKTPGGAMMIEFRCDGVQDVLPPTIHPFTGRPYEWGGGGHFNDLPELPAELHSIWRSLLDPGMPPPRGGETADTAGAPIIEGSRNDTLYKRAGDLARLGLSEQSIRVALQEMNQDLCKPPLHRREVRSISRSASLTSYGAKAYRAGVAAEPPRWSDPTPLPSALPPVTAFHQGLLPAAWRLWVMDIANRMQCPADFPAVAALVALSSLIGARVVVQPKAHDDWTVVPNLWGALVGRPGVKKSPALNEVLKLLQRLQQREYERWEMAHAAWELDCKVADMRGDANEKKAKGLALNEPAKARALLEPVELPAEPLLRRFIVNDATVEKLGELMQQNPWGILSYRDELYGLLTSLDRPGQEGSRSFYLQSFDGNQGYTFDRIGRGTVRIDRVCLAMIGGIQPGRIQEYVRGAVAGGSADDGLLQRFLLTVWPDITGDFVHVDEWPDTAARQSAWDAFERLAELQPASDTEPAVWRFDAAAQALFVEWLVPFEIELRGDELHPAMVSHLAKYRKLIPALALLFALIDTPDSGGVIGEPELRRALAWGDYLRTHANRLYSAAVMPETTDAAALLSKIKSGKLADADGVLMDSFTPRQIAVKGWSGLSTTDAVRKAANVLADYGWLRLGVVPSGDAIGRGRPSDRYSVNPAVWASVRHES